MNMNVIKQKLNQLFKNKRNLVFKYWPFLVIFLVSLTFFYPVWLQNKVPLPADALVGAHVPWTEVVWDKYPAGVPIKNQEITDAISQFYPWRSLTAKFWRAGDAPLWNQFMFSGYPFLATLHSASLYPLNFLYLILSDINAWTLLIFAQIFLGALFMYLFLKELGLSNYVSLFGGVIFSLSGYMIAWLEFATGGQAGIWLPLLLLIVLRLIKSRKTVWVLAISFVFFFVYTAGDFQVPLYITATYFLFSFYYLFSIDKTAKLATMLNIFIGWLFGVLLSLPQLLPTFELFRSSVRVDDPYIKEYFYGLMHWEKIVNFLWPDFFGNVVTRNYWGKNGYHEYLAFIGVIPLVFVLYSLVKKKKKVEIFFWLLLVLSLIFLFPTPLAFLPYKLSIPGLGTSSASRLIFLIDFCLVTLASFGLSKWIRNKDKKLLDVSFLLLITSLGVGLGLLFSIYIINTGARGMVLPMFTNLKVSLKNMIPATMVLVVFSTTLLALTILTKKFKIIRTTFFKLTLLLIFLVTLADMMRFAWKNTPFSPREFVFPTTKIIKFLQSKEKPFRIAGGIPLNYFMQYGLSSAEGYDPIYPKMNSEWYSYVNSGGLTALSGRYGLIHDFSSPLINYANVSYVVDYRKDMFGAIKEDGNFYKGVKSPQFTGVFSEGRVRVFENTYVLPRVWLTRNYRVASAYEEDLNYLRNGDDLIIFESDPQISFESESMDYEIENFKQEANTIEFDAISSNDAFLFLSESYDPGWQAFVDGRKVEIYKANQIFQTIFVSRGEHKVKFIYNPKSYKIGVRASMITLILLSVYGTYYGFFEKRRKL